MSRVTWLGLRPDAILSPRGSPQQTSAARRMQLYAKGLRIAQGQGGMKGTHSRIHRPLNTHTLTHTTHTCKVRYTNNTHTRHRRIR